MKIGAGLAHGAAIVVLLALFGGKIMSMSWDLVGHLTLAAEIVRREPPSPLSPPLSHYPPLSHWAVAILVWITSAPELVAIWLAAIAVVYACYYLIGRFLTLCASVFVLPIFFVIFLLLARSHAQIGWEIIVNFFYPQ